MYCITLLQMKVCLGIIILDTSVTEYMVDTCILKQKLNKAVNSADFNGVNYLIKSFLF